MDVSVSPRSLSGEIRAIPSKSDVHRKLICAALSAAPSRIELLADISAKESAKTESATADISAAKAEKNAGLSADISATIRCLTALGAKIETDERGISVQPVKTCGDVPALDCGESGSTLRFLLPVTAALYDRASFSGEGRLPQRPLGELMEAMGEGGVRFSAPSLPFETSGRLRAGKFMLPGNVSSQYVTGLMLALPRLSGESEIILTSPLQSAGYVDLSLSALGSYGIAVEKTPHGWSIHGEQTYRAPKAVSADGDWSNAAFFLCAGALGASVTVTGLDLASPQGDREILNILARFGARVEAKNGSVTVSPPDELCGCEVDMREIPDLLPVLSVVAACAKGETRFSGAGRLRLKESDRLSATAKMLSALGGEVSELPEGLLIRGGGLKGGSVNGFGDHRMVMAAAIASICCASPVEISGAEAVDKSYPAFFDDFSALGGEVRVL